MKLRFRYFLNINMNWGNWFSMMENMGFCEGNIVFLFGNKFGNFVLFLFIIFELLF